jgi:glucose/arabinose dehydrogenase
MKRLLVVLALSVAMLAAGFVLRGVVGTGPGPGAVPSIATSGMLFYTGDAFPHWRGNVFVGGLRSKLVARLELDGDKVVHEERLLSGVVRDRVRDLEQGPDGLIYLLTDEQNGRVLRIEPAG